RAQCGRGRPRSQQDKASETAVGTVVSRCALIRGAMPALHHVSPHTSSSRLPIADTETENRLTSISSALPFGSRAAFHPPFLRTRGAQRTQALLTPSADSERGPAFW